MPRRPRPLNSRQRTWFDRILVVGLLLFCLWTELLGDMSGDFHLPKWVVVGVIIGQVVPLWWRRSRPGLVLAVVTLAHLLQALLIDNVLPSQMVVPVVAYSAARWGTRLTRWSVIPISLVGAVIAGGRWTYAFTEDWSQAVPVAVTTATMSLIGWALGLAGQQRDAVVQALVERAEQTERMAERDVALAAQDERARIAREMHDVVAHGLSVIVVQADGARYAAVKDPAVAVDTLETIAATGRESLQEMRRLLGLLRTGDSGVRPQPTLADVPHLVAESAAAGTEIRAEIVDPLPVVSDGVGLAAYRFVQEALTNVRKHAGPAASVDLRLVVEGTTLVITVEDDGRGAASSTASGTSGSSGGLGLVGMRERVGVHGGEVTAGPRPGGGWSVGARIPL